MMLYINDEYCSCLEQLKGYFEMPLTADSNIYVDLLDYGRCGDLSKWLSDCGENNLAEEELSQKVKSINSNLSDSEYFAELKKVVTGGSTDGVASSLKPSFDKCFHLEGIELELDEERGKQVLIKLKVLFGINERYELVVSSNWGTRGQNINPSDYKEGEIIKLRFAFRHRPGKDWGMTDVRADGKELLPATELKRFCGLLQPNWSAQATESQKRVLSDLVANMVRVEGGTFTMGATSEQGSDADSDEKPTHPVTLSDYYIGRYEVTQAQWEAVMGNNPSSFKNNGSNCPVENVSWNDCQNFIKRLNSLTGLTFHLPTEAEWEYAARGGNKSKGYKYSGSNSIGSVAWSASNSSSKTHPVGTKTPNELGIYDMSGNVWEWCSDWYGSYSSNPSTNPTGPASGSYRVLRGGGWDDIARLCRVSYRSYNDPDSRGSRNGFRLALRP